MREADLSTLRMVVVVVVLLLLCMCKQVSGHFVADEERLRSDLLTNYSTEVRPEFQTQVFLSMTLSSLNHLDIASQSMSINVIIFAMWHDWRLMWDSTAYGGLDRLVVAPERIWTPPLVIENSVSNVGVMGGKDRDGTPVRMNSSGMVQLTPPSEVTVTCEMTIAHYPFDTQTCSLVIIGWTYPLSEMDLVVGRIDTNLYSPNGEFELTRINTTFSDLQSSDDDDVYRKIIFQVTFRRKWQFYGQNLLMPIILNSILMNAVFLLPIESGEKMGYSLTVLLSYTVFLTWVTENLPPVSTDTSILQVYLAVVLCLGCLATLLTMWVLRLYHQPSHKPLGPFYSFLATRILVPLRDRCCFRCRQTTTTDQGGAENISSKTKVFPQVESTTARSVNRGKHLDFGTMSVMEADDLPVKEPVGSGRGEKRDAWEVCPDASELTWQEFAVLMDSFLFWVFAAVLLILTSVILTLLYANY